MASVGLRAAGLVGITLVTLRWRIALAVIGLALILLSAAALAYVAWPLRQDREDFRPAPTLFAPPAAGVIQWGLV